MSGTSDHHHHRSVTSTVAWVQNPRRHLFNKNATVPIPWNLQVLGACVRENNSLTLFYLYSRSGDIRAGGGGVGSSGAGAGAVIR